MNHVCFAGTMLSSSIAWFGVRTDTMVLAMPVTLIWGSAKKLLNRHAALTQLSHTAQCWAVPPTP
eukprot:1137764-Pelagomonas_calceolata.AAC.3